MAPPKGPGFSIYLGKLGEMAVSMNDAGKNFVSVAQTANGPARVAENALGFFGDACAFPKKYKAACDYVFQGAIAGEKAFANAAGQLVDIEREYAARDDYYAKKFGVLDDNKKPKIPDLHGGASARGGSDDAMGDGQGGTNVPPPGSKPPATKPTTPPVIPI